MNRRSFIQKAQLLTAASVLFAAAFPGSAAAQEYRYVPEHRRPVEVTLHDLDEIASRSPFNHNERERYDNALHHLQQFGERLHEGGYFDKGKLDQAIGDVQSVIDHNRMGDRAHDILLRDVSNLRLLRQRYDDRTHRY